jgi:spore maturation protein CgeB
LGAIKSYKKIGANVIHYPVGANPQLFKSYNCEHNLDVIFLGKNKGYRRKIIKDIVDEGIDIRVWGDGWQNIVTIIGLNLNEVRASREKIWTSLDLFWSEIVWHIRHFSKVKQIFGSYLSFEEMVKTYSQSKITINFPGYFEIKSLDNNIDPNSAPKGLKGRDAEAPMSGAFYLTEHCDEITQMYKIGEEIETYRSAPELMNKIKYYLENPAEAESIRKAGRQRALKDYTWKKCFEKVFNEIGIS